jgi:hypothetical protein
LKVIVVSRLRFCVKLQANAQAIGIPIIDKIVLTGAMGYGATAPGARKISDTSITY